MRLFPAILSPSFSRDEIFKVVRFEAKVSSDRGADWKSADAYNATHRMTSSGGADPTRESRNISIVHTLQHPTHDDHQRQKKKTFQPTTVLDRLAPEQHQPQKKLDTPLKDHNATTTIAIDVVVLAPCATAIGDFVDVDVAPLDRAICCSVSSLCNSCWCW